MRGFCHSCEKYGRVRINYETGVKTCPKCQRSNQKKTVPKKQCVECGEIRPIVQNGVDGPYCAKCYYRLIWYPKQRRCKFCGKNSEKMVRIGKGLVCEKCFETVCGGNRCSVCRNIKKVHIRKKTGQAVCDACYMRSLRAKKAVAAAG